MPRGLAILVGLKKVNPATYGGWTGENGCWGCELDVDNMQRILDAQGFQTQTLKTAQATHDNVVHALSGAAQTLRAGDTLVFYYSGHGGQQPDMNGDEQDGHDETLVAYDREIVDDELNLVWTAFKPGVRIVMLSDSCNSGTNYRIMGRRTKPTPMQPVDTRAGAQMRAEMIHMGGCRDGAESSGYLGGGAFTIAICTTWKNGAFKGTYRKLYDQLRKLVKTGQKPAYNEYGPVSPAFKNGQAFSLGTASTSGGGKSASIVERKPSAKKKSTRRRAARAAR